MIRLMAALACALFLPVATLAEQTPVISTVGKGAVSAAPDMAHISLGVTARAPEAGDAIGGTTDIVAGLIELFTGQGIEARDIQTRDLSLRPIRAPQDPTNNTLPEITGFEARIVLRAAVRDLDRLGDILDSAVNSGANTLDGLTFALQDPQAATSQARKAAVEDALARASELADAAGITLGPILSIEEGADRGYPVREMAAARMSDAPPIAPGSLNVTVRVTVRHAIAN